MDAVVNPLLIMKPLYLGCAISSANTCMEQINNLTKRNAPYLLLCSLKSSDPVVKQVVCLKPTVPSGKDTLS